MTTDSKDTAAETLGSLEGDLNLDAEGAARFRKLTGIPKYIQLVTGIGVPLIGIAAILDIPFWLTGKTLYPQQFLGALLGMVMVYVYMVLPASPKRTAPNVPWYDWILAAISLMSGLYVAVFYHTLLIEIGLVQPLTVTIGALMMVAILEACRRLTGWPLVIIVLIFILYGKFGYLLPGILETKQISWSRLINQLFIGFEFVFGTALLTAGMIVLAFVLFGNFLTGTGGSQFILDISQALLGNYRGGPAKIAIVASGLFGTLSGSAVGNVASTGIMTIPLMKRTGYKGYFAGAVEAVSSTGGCIMPPVMGAAAFIMAEFLGMPYWEVALVAVIPALLFYLGEFIQVDLRAAREGLKGIPKEQLPSVRKTLIEGWVYLLPVAVLVYSLFGMGLRAEIGAMYAIGTLLVLAIVMPSLRGFWRNVPRILEDCTKGMLEVAVVCAAAGMVIGVISYTGLGLSFSRILVDLGGGNLLFLGILTAIASTILGMGMPVTATYLFLAVLAAPALVSVGVEPILAHLFVFYFGVYSFLTPPVCLAAYAAASIAKAPMMKTAWQAMKLAVAGYIVPFIFIYKPAMVFIGEPVEIAVAIVEGILAVITLAIAVEGYFGRPLNFVLRILLVVDSLAFFVPGWESRVLAFVLLFALLAYNYITERKLSAAVREEQQIKEGI
jgi:TRAP transporter 4TM/12TM fusion protein